MGSDMKKSKASKSQKIARHTDELAQHRTWLARAELMASHPINMGGSPHPSVKVGAVLVDSKGHEIAAASNRFPYGVDRRRPERYKEGSKSLWINCAEQIAITQALRKRADIKGAKLYVTLEPCAVCSGLIAELRLKHVFVPVGSLRRYARLKPKWKESIEIGMIKLAEADVPLTAIDTSKKKRHT
jgi:tRNA(Arg) A34 adenosine deaminase TadA